MVQSQPNRAHGLVDLDANVLMAWTPRAACTLAVAIFCHHLGRLAEAVAFEPTKLIHGFRAHRLARNSSHRGYIAQEADFRNASLVRFKVVRNPFSRAVSTWVHQMQTNFSGLPELQHRMAATLGHARFDELSFVSWLRAVRNITLGPPLDMHSLPQTTDLEASGAASFDFICKLEEGFEPCLEAVRAKSGTAFSLPPPAFKEVFHESAHEEIPGDVASMPWNSFRLISPRHRVLPHARSFYMGGQAGREAAPMVSDLYAVDFERYGYDSDVAKYVVG